MNDDLSNYIHNEILTRPNQIEKQLSHNGKKYNHRLDFNYITEFLDNFIEGDEINRYLVLPGLRDTGKTTILYQVYEYLHNERKINANNILYLSAEKLKSLFNMPLMEAINTYLKLYHNSDMLNLEEKIFLLIDEAQCDKNWSITGKIAYDSSKNIFMIFTGSSALELEYNADSARRILKIPITPLNYSQHLKLKYDFSNLNISKSIMDLIFDGKMDEAMELEMKIFKNYSSIENYSIYEWDEYLNFGGFPSSFYQENHITSQKLIDMIERVVYKDMESFRDMTSKSQTYTKQLIYFLALQRPGEISQNAMANHLGCPASTVNTILSTLEKTHLIFHVEPYSLSPKRGNKTFKYYFATPSLRHALCLDLGIASNDPQAYKGRLLENLVAAIFNNLKNENGAFYKTYFDSKSKKKEKNVDFIVQRGFDNPIPIEVGIGNKRNTQIRSAIRKYKSDYGIVISNNTAKIEKEYNIINIPVRTFSLM
ncbi:MAG: ATP-binding protein [Methanobrevibacter sp.]|nr:ATP-binding protein [Methanobrevibacter sp.]